MGDTMLDDKYGTPHPHTHGNEGIRILMDLQMQDHMPPQITKFTSKWWRELHKILGAKLLMSMSFHPQTDRQTECINRSVGQIFHTVVRPGQKNWVDRLNLTEFAINASISETTKYAPFELNGGYMPSMIKEIRTDGIIPKGIQTFAQQALQNLADVHNAIIESQVFQTHNANHC